MFIGEGDIGEELSLGSRCNHRHPLLITHTQTGRRARCMGCGKEGPVCAGLSEAMQALRSAPVGISTQAYPPVAAGRAEAPRAMNLRPSARPNSSWPLEVIQVLAPGFEAHVNRVPDRNSRVCL
jgi:hypothetical protein